MPSGCHIGSSLNPSRMSRGVAVRAGEVPAKVTPCKLPSGPLRLEVDRGVYSPTTVILLTGFDWASLVAQVVKNLPALWETWV